MEINKIYNMDCLEGLKQTEFMGSGTTAIACRLLNRQFIGFELNQEYHKIAEARLSECQKQKKLFEVI